MRSAVIFQFLAGVSLAGTYMPGLKLIADRIQGILHPRFVAFYTTSFTIGSSLSFAVIGQLAQWFSWRLAIALAALGPAIAWLLITRSVTAVATRPTTGGAAPRSRWLNVLGSAAAMRYVAAYACHMWELFAIRAWLVAFLTFCERAQG